MTDKIITGFPLIANEDAQVLILGSMPGVASLNVDEYYGHPRNSFWWIMGEILNFDSSAKSYKKRCEVLVDQKIALWDVIYQCKRKGSLDSAIDKTSLLPNDFEHFFSTHQDVTSVYCNGGTAFDLFIKHVAKPLQLSQQIVKLPSTSPAYAAVSKEKKLVVWKNHFSM